LQGIFGADAGELEPFDGEIILPDERDEFEDQDEVKTANKDLSVGFDQKT